MQIYHLGTRIGQYEIASNPMIGGMGVVYFCLDHTNDGRPVALKTFKPEYLPDRAARDRFLREGTAWVQLGRHPHIVRCYGVEYIDPIAFLSLELIATEQGMDDASLRSWLRGAPMPVEQALLFALQIARGMKYATEKIPGFVHRDLKPENVLVGADKLPGTNINRLRVTDFGLAAILKDEVGKLQDEDGPEAIRRTHLTNGIVGTPLYMAPEQWKGEIVGVYTDIYALGCILYEMLTSQRAANGLTISELQAAHCAGKLRPLLADWQWPRELCDLLNHSLALRPADRYQSWDEVTGVMEQAYKARGLGSVPEESAMEAESLDERKQAGWSYDAIGIAYADIGKTQMAADYFKKALAIAHETGDWSGEGVALGNLGNVFADLGDAQRAIGYYERHLAIARETGNRRGEANALGNLGIVYKDLGDAQRAIGLFEQCLELHHEVGNGSEEGNLLGNLGTAYAVLGDTQRAIGYYKQHLAVAYKIGDRRGEGIALGNLGIAYRDMGDVHQAIRFFEQHLVIAREIGDRRGEGSALSNLGITYGNLGEVRQTIGFFEQHLVITREIGDRRGEGKALGNLGLSYKKLGDARRAIEFYEQSLTINREINNLKGIATDSFNLANLYTQQGDSTRVAPLVQEAARIWVEIGNYNINRNEQKGS